MFSKIYLNLKKYVSIITNNYIFPVSIKKTNALFKRTFFVPLNMGI